MKLGKLAIASALAGTALLGSSSAFAYGYGPYHRHHYYRPAPVVVYRPAPYYYPPAPVYYAPPAPAYYAPPATVYGSIPLDHGRVRLGFAF